MKQKIRIWVMVAVGVALVPCGADAQEGDEQDEAKAAYEAGKQLFTEKKYEEAAEKFTEAYNLTTEPNLLFNLAACAERLGDPDRAIAYYEVYLEEAPDAPDAEEVRKRLALLKSGKWEPPQDDAPVEPEPEPASAPEPEPTAATTTTEPSPAETASAEAFYRAELEKKEKKPFWPQLTIGLGGMVLASGVITSVLAYKEYDALKGSCKPDCTDDDISTARGLAIASDVQYGVGAVVTVIGVVGLIKQLKERKTEQPGEAPKEKSAIISLSPSGLGVQGRF